MARISQAKSVACMKLSLNTLYISSSLPLAKHFIALLIVLPETVWLFALQVFVLHLLLTRLAILTLVSFSVSSFTLLYRVSYIDRK